MSKKALVILVVLEAVVFAAAAWFWLHRQPRIMESTAKLTRSRVPHAPPFPATPPGQKPRNVVIAIGDGMGLSAVTAGRLLLHGLGGQLTLDRLPVTGWHNTATAFDAGTDSGAGATALATGVKTRPGSLGVDAEGKSVPTLFEVAGRRGMAVGAITDSYLWDATPGGFLAHCVSRRDFACVTADLMKSNADLLVGSESPKWKDDDRTDGIVLSSFHSAGYQLSRDFAALRATPAGTRALGLLPAFSITPGQGGSQLPGMVDWALGRLGADPEGFVLLIETEETDTGSHDNDLDRTVRGIAALDAVVGRLAEYVLKDGNTLLLVTSDHETGGLSVLEGGEGDPLLHSWGTDSHSAEPVPIYALGPGAERFTGTHENTDVAKILAELLGLELK